MKTLFNSIILGSLILSSCGSPEQTIENQEEKVVEKTISDKEELIEVKGDLYTEYYPGKKQIKFQGTQDEAGKRHGLWKFYNEKGMEISSTMYEHGLKHGHSIVKYENGAVFYVGEYENDQQIGVWKTYDKNGTLNSEKDFGSSSSK